LKKIPEYKILRNAKQYYKNTVKALRKYYKNNTRILQEYYKMKKNHVEQK